jgi:hypothetical protein
MSCELVCTGWYSSNESRTYQTFGDDLIRSKDFRSLWWNSMDTFVQPENVLIVDSASPIKPNDNLYTTTHRQYIELLKNSGHSQNCTAHYCGYMASVILGLEYALHNDVELFIYIEQDALIYGKDLIKKIKQCLKEKDLVFGDGGKFGDIEQSIFAANKKGIRKFLSALHAINFTDRQIQPEFKFMYAASKMKHFPLLGLVSWDNNRLIRRASTIMLHRAMPFLKEYEILPFGYGRIRPINFSDELFYFQQGNLDEITAYRTLTGF